MKRINRFFAALLALCCLALPAAAQSQDARTRLTQLGYLSSSMTDMEAALRNFQTANGIPVTGSLDTETLRVLFLDDAVSKQTYLQSLAAKYADTPLSEGDTGEAVRELQATLIELGYYSGQADGVFGKATCRAVMAFQTANGLYASGAADSATLTRLLDGKSLSLQDFLAGKICVRGDTGAGVRSLQRRLRLLGYYDGECSGTFGESTQSAVLLFQQVNGIEATGAADEATCRLLYSGAAASLSDDSVLGEGDTGDAVRDLQLLLHSLGYFGGTADATYGPSTLVAVTLYQIANGLNPTGEADEALVESMRSPQAVPLSEATDTLRAQEVQIGGDVFPRAAAVASDMLGKAFSSASGELFPGFSFVQYVYARVGVGLSDPGRAVEGDALRTFDAQTVASGEIVLLFFEGDSAARVLYAVSLGGTRVAYADSSTGYIVSGDLASMAYSGAYIWGVTNG